MRKVLACSPADHARNVTGSSPHDLEETRRGYEKATHRVATMENGGFGVPMLKAPAHHDMGAIFVGFYYSISVKAS